MSNLKLVKMSEMAEQLKIKLPTIQHYRRLGLLKAEIDRPEAKLVLFDINYAKRTIDKIQQLKDRGYTLADMRAKL